MIVREAFSRSMKVIKRWLTIALCVPFSIGAYWSLKAVSGESGAEVALTAEDVEVNLNLAIVSFADQLFATVDVHLTNRSARILSYRFTAEELICPWSVSISNLNKKNGY